MEQALEEKLKDIFHREAQATEVRSMLVELVAIPSYPGCANQELAICRWISDYCQQAGIPWEIIELNADHHNIIATIDSGKPGPVLALCGHLDTVPPYEMQDALVLRETAGRLYGRGTVDMKGAVAAMLLAMKELQAMGLPRKGKLIFAGIADEEGASTGARALIRAGFAADGMVIGEPTDHKICVAHRGLEWLELTLTGKAVHGGKQREGLSAISRGAEFIRRIETAVQAAENRRHPLAGSTSFNVGTIQGGTQPSTVAGECRMTMDLRWIPGDSLEHWLTVMHGILEDMQEETPLLGYQLATMAASHMEAGFLHQAVETPAKSPVVQAVCRHFLMATGKDPVLDAFPAWSDGGIIGPYGNVPVVICGPGELAFAHTAEEHVPLQELLDYALLYALAAIAFTG